MLNSPGETGVSLWALVHVPATSLSASILKSCGIFKQFFIPLNQVQCQLQLQIWGSPKCTISCSLFPFQPLVLERGKYSDYSGKEIWFKSSIREQLSQCKIYQKSNSSYFYVDYCIPFLGKGKESDPTDASVNTSADVWADSRSTVSVIYVKKILRLLLQHTTVVFATNMDKQ